MEYIKIIWEHQYKDEPIILFLEIDHMRYNTRKIEIFKDGKVGFAFDGIESGAGLVEGPFPTIEEYNKLNEGEEFDEVIKAYPITPGEFELVWKEKVLKHQQSLK